MLNDKLLQVDEQCDFCKRVVKKGEWLLASKHETDLICEECRAEEEEGRIDAPDRV